MSISEKSELCRQRISEYQASNLTAHTWYKQDSVFITALRYWITKFNKESDKQDTQWISVKKCVISSI